MSKVLKTMVASSLALGLVGCANNKTDNEVEFVTEVSEPVTIEFWHAMSGANGEVLQSLVDKFNDEIGKDKGIAINATFQGGYTDLKSKLLASIKAGNSPTIAQGTSNDIYELYASGMLQNLDEYIYDPTIGMNGEYELTDIYEVYRGESTSYSTDLGHYSLPFAKSTDLLFYNDDFFKDHGLEVPTTWDEVVEVSKEIHEITGKPGLSVDNTANYLITMLEQLDAGYTTKEGELLFNDNDGISEKIINDFKTGVKEGYFRTAGEDGYSSGPFNSGLVQMYIGSSSGSLFLTDEFNWEATVTPQFDVENPKYISQGNNLALIKQNKSASEVLAGYEFIKFMTGYDANLYWSVNTGYLPIRNSVANSEEYQSIMNENSDKLSAVKSTENGFVEPLFANGSLSSNIVRDKVGVMFDEAIATDVDVKELLDRTVEQLNNY